MNKKPLMPIYFLSLFLLLLVTPQSCSKDEKVIDELDAVDDTENPDENSGDNTDTGTGTDDGNNQNGNGDGNTQEPTGELKSIADVRAKLGFSSDAYFSSNWENRKLSGGAPVETLITEADFKALFPENIRNKGHDKNLSYYNWSNFVEASKYFPNFLNEGSEEDKYLELAAFFGNKSHETGDGWPALGTERWNYGLFWIVELAALGGNINPADQEDLYKANSPNYTDNSNTNYPPVEGKSYHGRGPVQLSWNYNYGAMSDQMFQDKSILLGSPDLIAREGIYGWASAIWFWMEPQGNKPAAHDVMVGNVDLSEPYNVPTSRDNRSVRTHMGNSKGHDAAGNAVSYANLRVPAGAEVGFGMTINIINGGLESNTGSIDNRQARRIGYFARYLDYFGKQKLGLSNSLSPQISGGGDPVTNNAVQLMQTWKDWHYLPGDGNSPGNDKDFPSNEMPNIMSNIWTSSF